VFGIGCSKVCPKLWHELRAQGQLNASMGSFTIISLYGVAGTIFLTEQIILFSQLISNRFIIPGLTLATQT
jgi:hypothetical protein